jgi:hypothetical protein
VFLGGTLPFLAPRKSRSGRSESSRFSGGEFFCVFTQPRSVAPGSSWHPVKTRIAVFNLGVTEITHDLEVIERSELFSHTVFLKKQPFTFVAPGLQIVRVRAVLNKADDTVTDIDLVTADYSWRSAAVSSAFDYRFIVSHF